MKNKKDDPLKLTEKKFKDWNPIITWKTTSIFFILIGIIFIIIGFILIIKNSKPTSEIFLDYTRCKDGEKPSGQIKNWKYDKQKKLCELNFMVNDDITPPIYLYYNLGNYIQNYKEISNSYSKAQLSGKPLEYKDLESCKPLIGPEDKSQKKKLVYYPCGLLANSYFMDIISTELENNDGKKYKFSEKNISWPADKRIFKKTEYNLDQIRIPPLWQRIYGSDKYTKQTLPDLSEDEHFHNWMRPSSFSETRKLYGRNDNDILRSGEYQIKIINNMEYKGLNINKSIIISNSLNKNNKGSLLGYLYLIIGIGFLILGILIFFWEMAFPKKIGDYKLLLWLKDSVSQSKSDC